ncbi:putative inorganic phosphate cotransporter isoform X2 [Diorhabda carinulata]|uniref:putative inorganic phosphate cotransporter isoform X2 n=1 Tax=Diorhabda carinulata TaxID=1163345 RepID=UPI0025A0356C|nr:putative inorganic phosphate cotransporter isoform X2 [Diorhabda carinulata]
MIEARRKSSVINKEELLKLIKTPVINSTTFGTRHVQIILIFLLSVMTYVIRISMSVIIVAMTDPTSNRNKEIPVYNWTDKSLVVTSFVWGYMIPQIVAGYLATNFGAKWFLAGSVIISSSLGLLIPVTAAILGSKGVMGLRLLQGISQGCFYPSIHAFLSKWVPVGERSRLGTLPYVGAPIGTVSSMLLTGWIASGAYGWPMAVYVFSGIGLTVGLAFTYFGSDEPNKHRTITEEERVYINSNLTTSNSNEETKNIPVPWLDIFTSLPFWALLVAQIGWCWSNWTLLLETPIYMNHVMKFNLKSNSVLSSLPYIAEAVSAIGYSVIADYLIVKNICSIGKTRKIMNFIGMVIPGIALVALAFCDSDDAYKAVTLLVAIGLFASATRSGYNVNLIDLAPNFAGILMGICNGTGAAVASLGPLVIHLLVKDENDPNQWKMIFYISAAMSIVSFIFNCSFTSGSIQPWNEGSKKYRGGLVPTRGCSPHNKRAA